MRALTIQQPYAWAILRGGKDVENRSDRRGADTARQIFNRPGKLLIHAGARYAAHEGHREVSNLTTVDMGAPGMPKGDPAWAFGALIGVVDLVGVHTAAACEDPITGRLCSPWAHGGATTVHLQLTDPRVLTVPIQMPGQLGLWKVTDAHLQAAVRRQLA